MCVPKLPFLLAALRILTSGYVRCHVLYFFLIYDYYVIKDINQMTYDILVGMEAERLEHLEKENEQEMVLTQADVPAYGEKKR